MKKKKNPFIKTYILFGITIIIGLLTFLDNPYKDNDNQKESENVKLFSNIQADDISSISITKNGDILTLIKQNEWLIQSDDNYLADKNSVTSMTEALENLKRGEVASTNPEKQSTYKVQENQNTLKVSFKTTNTTHSFYIGIGGPSRDSQYLRNEESDEVLLVRKNLSAIFDKTNEQIRDKTIFSFDENAVKNITIQSGKNIFELTNNNDTWSINGETASNEKVTSLISAIAKLQASGFVMQTEEDNDYNTSDNNFKIKVNIELNEDTKTLYIGEIDDTIYAKKDSSETIFKINSYLLNQLDINIDDYKEEETAE